MFYVYIIENENHELYFGSTNDLRRRMQEHQSGKVYSTKSHTWELIYYEAYKAESDARIREKKIKLHGQAKAHLKNRILASRRQES
ncbi:GIY-YIG nuclease family protein [bacterium]|nr:GIY-YIG nuclease family protein [bacterium]